MTRTIIQTNEAPGAIGPYSQAVRADDTVYISGQIPLDPATMEIVEGGIADQARRVLDNIGAIARAAGGTLGDIVKLTVYITELSDFTTVNDIMSQYFSEPYPARATIGGAKLPKGARVEIEAVLVLRA